MTGMAQFALPAAWGEPPAEAVIRATAEDFRVTEIPGFALSGDGEHVFLYLEKRHLNTVELAERLAKLSATPLRDIGYSGLKDRNALTRQWFSVRMAGRSEPDWSYLEAPGDVRLLALDRHQRKLRRGTHSGNRFQLRLRELRGPRDALITRLQLLQHQGAPNYFGPQRFGRAGATLVQAERWARRPTRVSRARRSLYLSALRASLFNRLLAARVSAGSWNRLCAGDQCMLAGSRSFFTPDLQTDDLQARLDAGDIHPGLPLWGRAGRSPERLPEHFHAQLGDVAHLGACLEEAGLDLAWRPTRVLPDDFSWQFCDDGVLQLDFTLGVGSYATALLAEFVRYREGDAKTRADGYRDRGGIESDRHSEQG